MYIDVYRVDILTGNSDHLIEFVEETAGHSISTLKSEIETFRAFWALRH